MLPFFVKHFFQMEHNKSLKPLTTLVFKYSTLATRS